MAYICVAGVMHNAEFASQATKSHFEAVLDDFKDPDFSYNRSQATAVYNGEDVFNITLTCNF